MVTECHYLRTLTSVNVAVTLGDMTSQTLAEKGTAASLERLEDLVATDTCTVEQLCAELARAFRVRVQEVALLQVERLMLTFLHPAELRAAGAIPLTSSAVAARTANMKRAEIFNAFATVQHSSIFETVKFPTSEVPNSEMDALTIQKLMSAPVMGAGNKVAGVIQICRKGFDANSAGADFTGEDMEQLKEAARVVGVFLARNRS